MQSEIRYVQAGESAGPDITLKAAVLRSRALSIMGTAGIPPRGVLAQAFEEVMGHAAKRELHIETELAPLQDVEKAWQRELPGRRLVMMVAEKGIR